MVVILCSSLAAYPRLRLSEPGHNEVRPGDIQRAESVQSSAMQNPAPKQPGDGAPQSPVVLNITFRVTMKVSSPAPSDLLSHQYACHLAGLTADQESNQQPQTAAED